MFHLVLVSQLVKGRCHRNWTLPWQPILGAKSAKIGETPSFLGLAFHNGWHDGKVDGRINTPGVLPTMHKNLVN